MKKILRFLIIGLAGSIVVDLIGVVFIFFLITISRKRSSGQSTKFFSRDVKTYKSLTVNINENTTSVGIVSMYEDIEMDRIMSFSSVEGMTFISNFGTSEYLCTGSCYCHDERRTGALVSRGMRILVASVSSLVAINTAKELLLEDCYDHFSEEESCTDKNNIRSEIEDCHDPRLKFPTPKILLDEKDKVIQEGDFETGKYFCMGKCVENLEFIKNRRNHLKTQGKEFTSKERYRATKFCSQYEAEGYLRTKSAEEHPEDAFTNDILRPFCKKMMEENIYQHLLMEDNNGQENENRLFRKCPVWKKKEGERKLPSDENLEEILRKCLPYDNEGLWLQCSGSNPPKVNRSVICVLTSAIDEDKYKEVIEYTRQCLKYT